MIEIGDKIVATNIFDVKFVCNLNACKGICCIDGDAGAPITEQEIKDITKNMSGILPHVHEQGKLNLKKHGFYEIDIDGEKVTTCAEDGACNFVNYDKNGITYCGIEKAYLNGDSNFHKPLSCHLYPIRLLKYKHFTAVNYDKRSICNDACVFGKTNNTSVYQFLKVPLIRAFGNNWYSKLEAVAKDYKREQEKKSSEKNR